MKYIVMLISFFIILKNGTKAQLTPFEKSNGNKTATYAEAIQWYKNLGKISTEILVKEMGPTDAGYPLHLVMLSGDKTFDPIKWHSQKKVVIMINNGIHPGEPDGIDASMMLVRDILKRKIILPQNVALAFIPVYNIGGCLNRNSYTRANQNGPLEYGFRGNSQNLDLNRDFTKADTKEAKTFIHIFHFLNPDILIDNHVSDGADYQHTMTLISTQYNKLNPLLGKWLKEDFEPAIYQNMKTKNWDLIPYVDFETTDFEKGMQMFYDPPRYSSGYGALFNTLSFMPETHMLKPFKERVKSTYDLMVSFIEAASQHSKAIIELRKKAQESAITQQTFPLKWIRDSSLYREIIFKGYESDFIKSEATGLQKMFYNHEKPFTKKIKFFDVFYGTDLVKKPLAYIIPQGWYAVVDLLKLNGVNIGRIKTDTAITVTAYQIINYKSSPSPYEKHHKNNGVAVSLSEEKEKFYKGDYIIHMNQPVNRFIIEMLEPTGDDSYFSWNYFDGILQQKEGYSVYRWEDIAADILKHEPSLKQKLEEKKASDPTFAQNSSAILNFIYKNSAYAEKAFLKYPVFRIEER
ncbi:MAG: M14 family metallopeptidase [Ferruginibacter sp.]